MNFQNMSVQEKTKDRPRHQLLWLTALALLLCLNSLQAQELNYTVLVNGHESGVSKVMRTDNGSEDYSIEVQTDLHIRMLLKIHLNFSGKADFANGRLIGSEVTVYNNDHLHSKTITTLNGNSYHIVKDDKKLNSPTREIRHTGYNLYYQYPKGIDKVYSLSEGSFDRIEVVNDKEVTVIDGDNRKNTYKYNDEGVLSYLKLHHTVYNIEFVLKE